MQDNIRFYFTDKESFERIIKSGYRFTCSIDSEEIKNDYATSIYPIKGQIGTMTFVINQNEAYIENSIHKYHNYRTTGKEINYNDFSFCNIIKTLDDIRCQIPEYDFRDTKITSLEFGFNLKLEQSAKEIIQKNILLWDFKPHYVFQNTKDFVMKKFKMGNTTFKIYDKGAQNKLDHELLRMEIKYNYKQLKHKNLGIITFLDLYNPQKIELLFNDFIKRFDKLIIVDNRYTSTLSKSEIEYLGNQLEYTTWIRSFKSGSTKYRHKNKFREFNLTTTYHYLKQKIVDKYHQLFRDCEGEVIQISE